MSKNNQNTLILKHLQENDGITPLDALNLYGCFRLSGRIYDLKQQGYNIKPRIIKRNGKRFAFYYLIKEPQTEMVL